MRTPPPAGYKRTSDWIGRTVRTLQPITTGMAVIPSGTVCKVTGILNGLCLEAEPCKHCGAALRVTRVPSTWVRDITKPEERADSGHVLRGPSPDAHSREPIWTEDDCAPD